MSDASTRRMIEMYMDEAEAPMFLSGFFQSPQRNFHNTKEIEFDIQRDDEDIAVVVNDLSVGGRENESTVYTNKKFVPPIFNEVGAVNALDMIERRAGVDPFQDPNFVANAADAAFNLARKLENKIRRAIELMASQVLQTGTLTLIDGSGNTLYSLDFQPKTTHFVTAGNDWGTSNATYLADVEGLANVIRRDGRRMPKRLVFGKDALRNFIDATEVKERLDNRAMALGSIQPQVRGMGAVYHGTVWIGQYQYEMWSYDGFYKHPQTGVITPYVADDKVIILSEGARLDLTYGAIPRIVPPDGRALGFLPPRMSSSDRGLDLSMNAWFTPDGRTLKFDVGTRPLTIPTAIDTFGCLDTEA